MASGARLRGGGWPKVEEFPPSPTKALLEFALAGPAVGGALSLLVFLLGLALSIDLPLPDDVAANLAVIAGAASAGGTAPGAAAAAADAAAAAAKSAAPLSELSPVVPSSLLQTSLLLGSMASIFLPDLATSPAVAVHPLALVGFVGTLVNALQLLPIGRLDGGRVASAVLGQSNAAIVSSAALLLLGLSTLFGGDNPILLFFGLVVIFLQRAQELPCRDDVTGVSTAGKIAAGLGLAFCVLTLLPYPGAPVPMGGTPDVLSTLF